MEDRAEVLEHQAGYVFGGWQDVFIAAWRATTTLMGARRVGIVMERFAARHPQGISLVMIVEPHCDMPDGATRDLIAKDMKRHESFTRHATMIYEGSGFKAATIRSIMVGLQMLSRQAAPTKVCATVAEGAHWLAEMRSGKLDAARLEARIAELRRASDGVGAASADQLTRR